MREFYPLLAVGAITGVISIVFLIAYLSIQDKKETIGFDRSMKDAELLRRLMRYARPHIGSFAAVLVLMLFSIAYDILSPMIVGRIEDMLKGSFAMRQLFSAVAVYAGILIVSLVSSYIQAMILQKTGQRIVSSIREDVFSHIESLSHAQLNAMPVGKLVTRVTNDTYALSMMFTNIFVNLVKNVFVILGVLAAMLCLNYALTLMVLCFVPFIVLFTVIFRKFSRRAYRSVKDATTDINTFLSENLSGMKVIQLFNREERKRMEFKEKNDALGSAKRRQIFVFGIFRPLVYMLYISSVLCLLYLSGRGYIRNVVFLGQTIGSGTLVAFYMYISKFFNPIQSLAEQFNWLQSAFASAEKIFTILDISPQITDAPDAIELEHVEGEIEFRDVWFAYVPGEWVLRGVSFRIRPKETVAFVGSTGSGKTTILSLLCRNYDIQRGEILVDGIDIRRIRVASLRRHFGQMLQDVFLFSATIRDNILLREEGVSDEEIMKVCRYVNADGFISRLSGGLDEEVRERGSNFSAGQRQLLSFARTILHKPEVLILDEATANIDTETELLIQNSLEKLMNIGTMLIVAHRLSTIRHADNIIVLSHGEIVEQGTHEELLRTKGRYYSLYMLQENRERLLSGQPQGGAAPQNT
ncbi:MAG: ABC transporter ATP-binding protein [Eubacteriales bacterium]